jgi:hypothetical protein
MEQFIFDKLDTKLKEYIEEFGKAPKRLLLDPYAYMELKIALGYEEEDFEHDIHTWKGFSVLVNINQDEPLLEFV